MQLSTLRAGLITILKQRQGLVVHKACDPRYTGKKTDFLKKLLLSKKPLKSYSITMRAVAKATYQFLLNTELLRKKATQK